MKISFDNGGYIEFQRSKKPNHVHILVAARKSDNHLELLVNSAEISVSSLIEAVKSVSGPIIQKERQDENIE
jgi:REP element-mobilizing transposase RayT